MENEIYKGYTNIPELNINILLDLDKHDLYHACMVNKFTYNQCIHNKLLKY